MRSKRKKYDKQEEDNCICKNKVIEIFELVKEKFHCYRA